MGSDKARPAYVEDVEGDEDSDNNRTIRGTRVSARASKKEKKQRNDKDKEKRVAKEKKKSRSDDGYSSLVVPTRADERATVKEVRVIPDREPREGRRKSLNINPGKSPRKSSRPPAQRNVTFDPSELPSRPKDRNDPRYFGQRGEHPVVIQAQSTPRPTSSSASSQPRQARPMSISGSHISRPPLSGSAYYTQPIYTTPPILIPQQYSNPMQMAYSPTQPSSPSRKTLEDRFARTGAAITRPQSVSGYRPSDLQLVQRGVEYDDDSEDDSYDSEAEHQEALMREEAARREEAVRREARRRAKELQDAQDMPPPPQMLPRRRSVRQPAEQSIFLADQDDDLQPQPRRSRDEPRRSRDYGDYGESRRPSGDYERPSPRRPSPRRRQSRTSYEFDDRDRPALQQQQQQHQQKIMYRGGDEQGPPQQQQHRAARRQSLPRAPESNDSLSFAYDRDEANIRVEGASGRRASYYGGGGGGSSGPPSNYMDKIRDAAGYQADVSGEPVKLTADMLRKQQQHTMGSSRSTHSSNSRDESDFKRSVTTRTTRSVSGNGNDGGGGVAGDDVTIRIKGNAKVTIGAAEITNADGVELNIVNNHGGGGGARRLRNGSEASRSEYAPSQTMSQGPLSDYAPTATDERERERERERKGSRREILGAPPGYGGGGGRERTGSVAGARRRGFF